MEWIKKILQIKRLGFLRFVGDPSKLSDEKLRNLSKVAGSSTPAFRKAVRDRLGTAATSNAIKKKKKKPTVFAHKSLVTGALPTVRKKTLLG